MSDASGSESSDSEAIEWNVNSRSRRATAGNRLSSLLNQEGAAEDDEVQLLFEEAEDEPDNDFEEKDSDDADAGGGDSSSSSEDEDDVNDELAGERQLEKEERAQRKQQKRKVEQAFMRPKAPKQKRVKIAEPPDAATPDSVKSAEQKKKKKSERVSWFLNPEQHGAVRTSSRALSMKNKERTKASLKESEAKRKKSIAQSEAIRKRRMEQKGKPMTQEERLAEAIRTEEVNSQSLNHWEMMETERLQKERDRREALQNRRLEGPFVRWISTRAEWQDDRLVHVGRPEPVEEIEDDMEAQELDESEKREDNFEKSSTSEPTPQAESRVSQGDEAVPTLIEDLHARNDTDRVQLSAEDAVAGSAVQAREIPLDTVVLKSQDAGTPKPTIPSPKEAEEAAAEESKEEEPTEMSSEVPLDDNGDSDAAAPDKEKSELASTDPPQPQHTANQQAQPAQNDSTQPPPLTEAGMETQRPQVHAESVAPKAVTLEPEKPKITTYSAQQQVSLFNFSEPALQSLDTYRRVLFGWRSSQLSKPVKHAPQLCAVTSHPARYRDPTTGLAYKDIAALRRIKRITQPDGACKPVWSQAIGAWVGLEDAARGVPDGFLAPAPATDTVEASSSAVKQEDGGSGEKQ